MKFIIIHGAFGSPKSNWFPELKSDLELLDQEVIAPQFPVDDWDEVVKLGPDVPLKNQSLENWFKVFETEVLPKIDKNEKIVFVGHSLGPVFILHLVEKYNLKVECAIFVSPFMDKLDRWEFNHANKTFYKTDFDFEKLRKNIPVSYVLYSDNDPYVSKQHSLLFANALGSSSILVRRAGHMNSSVNLNEFPLVRDLCYSRLDLSLYQKFLEYYKRQSAQDYITQTKDRGVLKISPEAVVDEGIFHFRNLQNDGFCTLFTGLIDYWDPTSHYMSCAREASRRIASFVRVIVVEKKDDLKNPKLHEQIKLDLESNAKMYVVKWDDIKDEVKEPDFGIWDHDYVCVVRMNKETKKVDEAELNSKSSDIGNYERWREYILSKAVKIESADQDLFKMFEK